MTANGFRPAQLFPVDETYDASGEEKDTFMTPNDIQEHMHRLYSQEKEIMDELFGTFKKGKRRCDVKTFTVTVMPVTPSKFRPASRMGDKQFEHPQVSHSNQEPASG
jgi:DNA-directed RNA polymerase I subunit RPA1